MALDFPASPSNGQTFAGPGNVVWIYDGAKWTIQGAGGSTAWLPLAGGTMTGPLLLNADPTAALGSTTKQYTDAGVTAAEHNVGRNLLHNPIFSVAQRGVGPFTANGNWTADRWQANLTLDTVSWTVYGIADAGRTQIGDEAAQNGISNTFTGNSGATAYNALTQRIEFVRRLAGKTVTVSFWAIAGATPLSLGISINQNFGTGGSPSPTVAQPPQTVTLTTAWARYSLTFALPSVAGKTLGSNGDDLTALIFWFSASTNNNAIAGVGRQSGTISLWGVQLEVGPTMTPLDKPYDYGADLRNCQRFYQIVQPFSGGYAVAGTQVDGGSIPFVVMRGAAPACALLNNYSANVGAPTLNAQSNLIYVTAFVTATGSYSLNLVIGASADL
jgi:hypothetical protein